MTACKARTEVSENKAFREKWGLLGEAGPAGPIGQKGAAGDTGEKGQKGEPAVCSSAGDFFSKFLFPYSGARSAGTTFMCI